MFGRGRQIVVGMFLLTWLGQCLAGGADEATPSLDDLLKEYRKHDLPLPPRKAQLVRYQSLHPGVVVVNGRIQPQRKEYALAFSIGLETKKEQPKLLTGTRWRQTDEVSNIHEAAPEPDAAKGIDLSGEDGFILAIQCHERGWDKLARHALEQSQSKAKEPLHKQLLHVAWDYWYGRLTDPKLDRRPAAKHLKELIGQNKEWDAPYNRALLKSLDLALAPRKSRPGSIEALIDDLVDYHADTGTIGIFEPEERYWRIAKLGFDAVPALIAHLDDDRLTRARMQGFNNFATWHMRVGDVVSDLLEGVAGEETGRDWLDRQKGYRIDKAKAKTWWQKTSKVGEETYLLDHVFIKATENQEEHVNEHLLNVILAKYPKHIPSLYRTVLDKRPELDSGQLSEAIVRCQLPAKVKMDLFVYGAAHKDNKHRFPALVAMKELEGKQFDALLLATIEKIPKDVAGPYWKCPEAQIAGLATECNDPHIWPVLEEVAKRSAVGLRMEMLNALRGNERRAERLRLLAAFLDDDTVRILRGHGSRFEGPCAGFIYNKLEVRDFAALELAGMLGVEIEVKLDRKSEEWAKVRDRVREAQKREQDKSRTPSPGPSRFKD